MKQYYDLFNSCRLPRRGCDVMQRLFRTGIRLLLETLHQLLWCAESEGDCPSHIIVLCRGHFWRIDTIKNGNTLDKQELEAQLR